MKYCILLSLMVFGLSAHGAQNIDSRTIKIGGFIKERPCMFVNSKANPDGFAVELTESIMRSLKMPYEIVMFDRRNVSVDQILDSCDIMMACVITPDNCRRYHLTAPHSKVSYDIVYRNTSTYSSNRDLVDKRIVVVGNTVSHQKLQEFKDGFFREIIVVPTMVEGFQMLSEDKADYAVCNSAYSYDLISRNNFNNLAISQLAIPAYAVGLASKDRDLIVKVDSVLAEMRTNGSYMNLYYKWYGRDYINYVPAYFYWVLVGLIVLALIFVLCYIIMRSRIRKATADIAASKNRIFNLNQSINMVIDKANTSVYLYEIAEDEFYKLENGEFCSLHFSLRDTELRIHPDDREKYNKAHDKVINGGVDKLVCSIRIIDKDGGGCRDYEFTVTAQKDEHGAVAKLLYVRHDVSLQKQHARAQDEVIHCLNLALRSAQLTRWIYDPETEISRLIDIDSVEHVISNEEIVASVYEADRNSLEAFIQRLRDSSQPEKVQLRIRLQVFNSDNYIPCEVTAMTYYDEDGKPMVVCGIIRDISEIYNYQKQLNEKIELLEAIKNHMPVGLNFYDKEGVIVDMNEQQIRLLGVDKHKILSSKLNLFDLKYVPEGKKGELRKGHVGVYDELNHKDLVAELAAFVNPELPHGEVFEIKCAPVLNSQNEIIGYVSIYIDITDAKRNQSKIQGLQRKLTLALDAGGVAAWRYDVDQKLFTLLHGQSLNDGVMTLEQYKMLVHPDDETVIMNAIDDLIEREVDKVSVQVRFRIADEWLWYRLRMMAEEPTGEVKFISGTRKDVSDEIKAKLELETSYLLLRESQERLKIVLDRMPVPVYIKDPDTREFVYLNYEAIREIWNELQSCGKVPEEYDEKYVPVIYEFINKEFAYGPHYYLSNELASKIKDADDNIVETGIDYNATETMRLRDGTIIDYYVFKTLIDHNDKKQILSVRLDLTEQNKAHRESKILSISLSALRAYAWYMDTRDGVIHYGYNVMRTERDIYNANTLDKYLEFIHSDDRSMFVSEFTTHLQQDSAECTIVFRSDVGQIGEYEWWECRSFIETIHNGDISFKRVYGININIDKQKRYELLLQQNKREVDLLNRQNALILNNMTSALVYITPDYMVQWTNIDSVFNDYEYMYRKGHYCYEAFGYNSPCPDCYIATTFSNRCINRREVQDERRGKTFAIISTPIVVGDVLEGVVLHIDDVTDNRHLIDDLQKSKEKAEQSDKLKMAFLANMSHEIRTPLNAIVGFSDLMAQLDDPEERQEYGQIISHNSELLLKLINDILDLSKIEAGIIDFTDDYFDINELFYETYEAFKIRVSDDVDLVFHPSEEQLSVCIDRRRFMQVLNNLLSNAVKHTDVGEIEFGYNVEQGGVRFYVKDTGKGISDHDKENVFHRFKKLDDFTQGTGLGLSICKALVERKGGDIGFESECGKGAMFWAWFPCDVRREITECQSSSYDSPELAGFTSRVKPMNILIAEDVDSNYKLEEAVLKDCVLVRARSGMEAVELCRLYEFDLVLMDISMPIMDGLEATRVIRDFNTDIPIVVITANASESDRKAAIEAGCNDFLPKPLRRDQILKIIRRLV